jgi:hypothetical protein
MKKDVVIIPGLSSDYIELEYLILVSEDYAVKLINE